MAFWRLETPIIQDYVVGTAETKGSFENDHFLKTLIHQAWLLLPGPFILLLFGFIEYQRDLPSYFVFLNIFVLFFLFTVGLYEISAAKKNVKVTFYRARLFAQWLLSTFLETGRILFMILIVILVLKFDTARNEKILSLAFIYLMGFMARHVREDRKNVMIGFVSISTSVAMFIVFGPDLLSSVAAEFTRINSSSAMVLSLRKESAGVLPRYFVRDSNTQDDSRKDGIAYTVPVCIILDAGEQIFLDTAKKYTHHERDANNKEIDRVDCRFYNEDTTPIMISSSMILSREDSSSFKIEDHH